MNVIEKRMSLLLRHISNVRENCEIVGNKLIGLGKIDLGVELIARGQIHDNSKFYGVEWLYLHPDVKEHNPAMFKSAVLEHITHNDHHPEFYGSIHEMPEINLMELTCDICARSHEFGNDVNDWLEEKAFIKYNFNKKSDAYDIIHYTSNLLYEKAFV
jgi:Family of unknown function (DUF5662)